MRDPDRTIDVIARLNGLERSLRQHRPLAATTIAEAVELIEMQGRRIEFERPLAPDPALVGGPGQMLLPLDRPRRLAVRR